MEIIITIPAILIIINFIFLAAGNYFYDIIINYNKTNRYGEGYDTAAAKGEFNVQRYESLKKEYVNINSPFGYKISGSFIKNSIETKDTVIVVHGIGWDRWNSLKYADIFLDQGYNVFLYESRSHGETGGNHVSYGYYEKYDLRACIKYIKNKFPDGTIGIHGESLGASTAMLYCETFRDENDISFLIEDCGWSNLQQLYIMRAADYNVPEIIRPVLIEYLSIVCKLRSGFTLKDVSPIININRLKVPVLFIHGELDTFTPVSMAYDLYNLKNTGIKSLYIAQGADHAKSLSIDNAKYREVVSEFLNTVFNKENYI